MTVDLAAIWDLDGTLVDTERAHFAAWQELFRENGQDLSFQRFRHSFGRRNDDVLREFGFGGDDAALATLGARKEEYFLAGLEHGAVQVQRGAKELVEHLGCLGFRQAIASSAPRRNIEFILASLPFGSLFEHIVSAEEISQGKPSPEIFLATTQRLGLRACQCVVLEDAPAGVAAGKAAGCRVIAIEAGFGLDQLQEADLVVKSFAEVLWPRETWALFIDRNNDDLGGP